MIMSPTPNMGGVSSCPIGIDAPASDYIEILRLFCHSREISFKVLREAILNAEIAHNHFRFRGSGPDPAERACSAFPNSLAREDGPAAPPKNLSLPRPSTGSSLKKF